MGRRKVVTFRNITLEEIARVVNGQGIPGFQQLASSLSPAGIKHGSKTLGHVETVFNMISDHDFERIRTGEAEIKIVDAMRRRVDGNGRIISLIGNSAIRDPRRDLELAHPKVDYIVQRDRLMGSFPGKYFLPADQYQRESEELVRQLKNDFQFSRLLKGAWLPVCYPEFQVTDYGMDFKRFFLWAAEDSFKRSFSEGEFHNNLQGELAWNLKVINESHKRFLTKMAYGSFVGLQFFPFQGFSLNAVLKIMPTLPRSLLLSGPIDIAVAITAYPKLVNTPGQGLECAAVSQADGSSFIFRKHCAWGSGAEQLTFSSASEHSTAFVDSSAGLVYIGDE